MADYSLKNGKVFCRKKVDGGGEKLNNTFLWRLGMWTGDSTWLPLAPSVYARIDLVF